MLSTAGVDFDLYEASHQLGGAAAKMETYGGVSVDAGLKLFEPDNSDIARIFLARYGLAAPSRAVSVASEVAGKVWVGGAPFDIDTEIGRMEVGGQIRETLMQYSPYV